MSKPRHKADTKTFEELSFSEQAKSYSAQLIVIERAIAAHVRRSEEEGRNPVKTKLKCISQLSRMLSRASE